MVYNKTSIEPNFRVLDASEFEDHLRNEWDDAKEGYWISQRTNGQNEDLRSIVGVLLFTILIRLSIILAIG